MLFIMNALLSSFQFSSHDMVSIKSKPCFRRFGKGLIVTVGILAVMAGGRSDLKAGTCTVNAGTTYQTIDGFGFSSAWSGQMSGAQANTLFGTGNGQLGFSLLRVRIDPANNWGDETANASAAHSHGAKVLGSPWTPPASMKSNNNTVGGTLNTSQYAAYASYLSSAASSIGLDYVSMQNEPDANVSYESCSWSGATMATWCQNNAPSVGKPIVMPEAETFNDSYSDPTLNNSTAASHVTYLGGHIYGGGLNVHQNALNHGKHVWMTEHYNNGSDIGTSLADAREVSDCMNDQMSAYIWWYAFFSGAGCNLVNGSTPLLNGYALGQFARFVRPGYVRISTTYNPSSSVYVTAYKNGGTVVIVAINQGGSSVSQPFSLQNVTVSSFTPTVTSSSANMSQGSSLAVSSGSFTATLPAQSITTFVSSGSGGGGGGTLANGTYKIINLNSGLALDATGAATTNGTPVDQWTYNGGNNQKWVVTSLGGGQYSIQGVQSGRMLDVTGNSSANGAGIDIWASNGGNNQKWTIAATSGGYYSVIAVNSGKALDVTGNSTSNGTKIDQWTYTGGKNQQWTFQAP
jgi:glucuronoarabinoxylan endo-1,4-beta-xylanase